MTVAQLTDAFAARLEGYIVERINTRLRDALNVSMVALPKRRGRPPGSKNRKPPHAGECGVRYCKRIPTGGWKTCAHHRKYMRDLMAAKRNK